MWCFTKPPCVYTWVRTPLLQSKKNGNHLVQAQHRMKQIADHHRTEREFQVGDWVFLRLQPYKHATVRFRSNMKLSTWFYGSYQVIQRIGKVAYKLALPASSKIHPVFRVFLLRRE